MVLILIMLRLRTDDEVVVTFFALLRDMIREIRTILSTIKIKIPAEVGRREASCGRSHADRRGWSVPTGSAS